MSHRAFLGGALSLCLVACFAKTTSLGSATDGGEPIDAAGGEGGGSLGDNDASPRVDAFRDMSCVPTTTGKITCSNGELGVGREYCKSDDGTCGGAGHCVLVPAVPACTNLECGCDKKLYCNGDAFMLGHTNVAPPSTCTFACGTKTCDGITEHCWHGTGGVMAPDGGAMTMYECRPVPTECKTNHTCTCLLAHSGSSGPCKDTDGYLDLEVFLP